MKKSAPTKNEAITNGEIMRRAVVDIGSNSVRLVIFEGPMRAPMAICNEKALCGLGRDMTEEGGLNPLAVADALATLKRFRIVLSAYGNPPTETIATAAVREAKDGDAFVTAARDLGFDVKVISGTEEADLAAYGVCLVEPMATGLIGDMGGGSLELIAVEKGEPKDSVSLKIGPLTLMRAFGEDAKATRRHIESELKSVPFLKKRKFRTLYAVGGAWRSLSKLHMSLRHYPLSVLHHYALPRASAVEICDLVARQSRRSLEEMPGISRKRLDTLPYASVALKALLQHISADDLIVSSGGVREGLLYRSLSRGERRTDPLMEACRFFAAKFSPEPAFGAAAFTVIEPFFEGDDKFDPRILAAAAELADISAYFHPDLRGSHAFDTALSAPFVGVSHKERVWLALALYCRYRGRTAELPNEQALGLLSWDEQQTAIQAGLALRFAAALAPKSPELLKGCRLTKDDMAITFHAPRGFEALITESPRKKLESLSAAVGLALAFNFAD